MNSADVTGFYREKPAETPLLLHKLGKMRELWVRKQKKRNPVFRTPLFALPRTVP